MRSGTFIAIKSTTNCQTNTFTFPRDFKNLKKNVRNAAHCLIDELLEVWKKSFIPTSQAKHCIEKLERIHNKWLLLKKNKLRTSQTQKDREKLFVEELDKVFDIAHTDALDIIKIDEDRQFLIDQRNNRKMIMTCVDKVLEKQMERSQQRKMRAEEHRQKANKIAVSNSIIANRQLDLSFASSSSEEIVADEYKLYLLKKR